MNNFEVWVCGRNQTSYNYSQSYNFEHKYFWGSIKFNICKILEFLSWKITLLCYIIQNYDGKDQDDEVHMNLCSGKDYPLCMHGYQLAI